jgi:hypothetical protein
MRAARLLLASVAVLNAAAGPVRAQAIDGGGSAGASAAPSWEFGAALFAYFVPEDSDFAMPILTADRGPLHLEGRYNYESLDTGSLFVGWNFETGSTLRLEATAMVGATFGDLEGVAPGYELTLSYDRFSLYDEGEYLVDLDDSDGNFLYNWLELNYVPLDWLRVGLVAQRTRAYETGLDVQRGLLAGVTYKNAEFALYLFNPGGDDAMVVCGLSAWW